MLVYIDEDKIAKITFFHPKSPSKYDFGVNLGEITKVKQTKLDIVHKTDVPILFFFNK